MVILDTLSSACSNAETAFFITTIKKVVNVLWIVAPILAIIGVAFALFKLICNPEEKKYKNLFKNIGFGLVAVFLIPTIVDAMMKIFDSSFEVSRCWNAATEVYKANNEPTYIESNKRTRQDIYTDPEQYRTGEKQ